MILWAFVLGSALVALPTKKSCEVLALEDCSKVPSALGWTHAVVSGRGTVAMVYGKTINDGKMACEAVANVSEKWSCVRVITA